MRILYISSYYKPAYVYGGPVKSVAAMCEALAGQGAQVTVLTTNANGKKPLDVALETPLNVNGVTVYYYPITKGLPHTFFYSPALARACESMVRKHDVVVLETFFTHPTGPAVKACRKWNKPYVIPPRGQLLPWALSQKSLKKKLYMHLAGRKQLNNAAGLHCTDPTEVQSILDLKIKAPCFVVPNSVDSRSFADLPNGDLFRAQLNISKQATVLLMLGRLHPKKRPDIAVSALISAQSLPGETHLVMAGPDEMYLGKHLQAQAEKNGCLDKLHITGLLQSDKLLSAFAASTLLIMPSEPESENFGMSALEAMAAGLPVLVSEGVPIGLWAETYKAGRMAPCTTDAFKQALNEMLGDPSGLVEMGKKGKDLVLRKFDNAIVAQQMYDQFQAILSHGQPLSDLQLTEA